LLGAESVRLGSPAPLVQRYGLMRRVAEDQLAFDFEAFVEEIDLGVPLVDEPADPGQIRFDIPDNKPPYRIPSMKEIRAIPQNGYSVVSTFSGCGGSCLGFEMAGYRTRFASEFVPAAIETYRANRPDVPISTQDVREMEPELVMKYLGIERGELDVLEGSPPCASFSTAGKREEHWGQVKKYSDVEQRTDDLFDEYVRLIGGFMPKVFVAENVVGLLLGNAKDYLNDILSAMARLEYVVWVRELNAAWYGVPQNRHRVIFMGVRRDVGLQPAFPERFSYGYSIRDAIPWIKSVRHELGASSTAYGGVGHKELDPERPLHTVTTNSGQQFFVDEDVSIERFAIGEEWDKLEEGEQSEKYFNLVRPKVDEPVPTITATGGNLGAASVTHPTEKRKFTIAELKRLCSFPDDFVLTGSWSQQWERLGRAVPPLMMKAVAETIRDEILVPHEASQLTEVA
jgi:DNA (cytosine-5)-methyltransferase 1